MDYERQRFGTWFKRQREEHQFSIAKVARRLGWSVNTIEKQIEGGKTNWATIDRSMQQKIEDLLGFYPIHEEPEIPQNINFRNDFQTTAFLEELERDIDGLKINDGKQPDTELSSQPPDSERGKYCEIFCDRCPTLLGPKDDKCPECGRPVDDSH